MGVFSRSRPSFYLINPSAQLLTNQHSLHVCPGTPDFSPALNIVCSVQRQHFNTAWLLACGDVESNPGPTSSEFGTFHQLSMFVYFSPGESELEITEVFPLVSKQPKRFVLACSYGMQQ